MRKISAICIGLTVFLSVSFSQDTDVNITYTTLNPEQQKQAEHWGMTEEQWLKYEEYMNVEGKFFYEKVDPLSVMAMTSTGEDRELFMAKQLMFERHKVKRETSFANDLWKMQVALYGNEPLMDFRSLPWIEAEAEDWRLYKHPNTLESLLLRQEAEREKQKNEAAKNAYTQDDELWVFLPENCQGCKAQLSALKTEQPLKVSVYPLLSNFENIDTWIKQHDLEAIFNDPKMKLQIFNPVFFDEKFVPTENGIYQARQGNIVREL